MALGNWDTLAFNEELEQTSGVIVREASDGYRTGVEIYKNQLHIHDERYAEMCKSESCPQTETIAAVSKGMLSVVNFRIRATRGKQGGVYCLIKQVDTKEDVLNLMFGIGCYAYDNLVPKILDEKGIDYDRPFSTGYKNKNGKRVGTIDYIKDEEVHRIETDLEFDELHPYVGVKPETVVDYCEWLKEVKENTYAFTSKEKERIEQAINHIPETTTNSANQGSMFLSQFLEEE